jgi:glycosyltransferase involved in cell wall biosynthesis
MAHGLNFILDSIVELQISKPSFHFFFIGDGAERENLIKQSQKLSLKNVTFIESVSKKEVVDYLNITDVALVNLKKSDTFHTVIPSKIFESAAMGKPILLGLEGETKNIINTFNAGICYEPENKSDFINAIMEISKNDVYSEKIKGAFELAKKFDRKKIALEMLLSIENTK